MKKFVLVLISLGFTSLAFSQYEGYYAIFQQLSLIQTEDWTISDNRCFKANGETYVLSYEPFENKSAYDRNLCLYRKVTGGWEKASSVIRHDYFYWDISMRAIDVHDNVNFEDRYGTITIDPDKGIVTIGLKTWIWNKGEPAMHPIYDDLILTPNGDKMYDFILKNKK
jgi:hypothetical protein